jgi:RNA polymerase sigma-70 factor (ECF subfamily)
MPLKEDKIVDILFKNRLKLTAYVRSIVCDFHTAEDICQTVSLEAVQSAAKFNDSEHLVRWLWKVCRNQSIKKLSEQKRQPLILDEQILEAVQGEFEKASFLNSSDTYVMLEKCLDKLSAFARRLIKLRYQKNLTGTDLAGALNLKVGSVYVTLSRIHRKLQDCLKEQKNR